MSETKTLSQERILIIMVGSVGEVIMATTVAVNLKKHFHGCHVTWLTNATAAEILQNNPDIDRVIAWDCPWTNAPSIKGHWRRAWREIKKLREMFRPYDFDVALDLHNSFLTGLIAYASGATQRIGISDEHGGGRIFSATVAKIANPHKICRYMTALHPFSIDEFTPAPLIAVTPEMRKDARRFWLAHGVDVSQPILMVSVNAGAVAKSWPPDYFGAALQSVSSEVQIIFCGLKKDAAAIKKAQHHVRGTLSVAGETTLTELAALFADASLLLTADSSLCRLAEAVGLRTLSLWGPTRPEVYGSLNKEHTMLVSPDKCVGCQKNKCKRKDFRCMKAIKPADVGEKLREILEPYL